MLSPTRAASTKECIRILAKVEKNRKNTIKTEVTREWPETGLFYGSPRELSPISQPVSTKGRRSNKRDWK